MKAGPYSRCLLVSAQSLLTYHGVKNWTAGNFELKSSPSQSLLTPAWQEGQQFQSHLLPRRPGVVKRPPRHPAAHQMAALLGSSC